MRSEALEHGVDPRTPNAVTELEAKVQYQLSGQIRDFRLTTADRGLILRGHAQTYYAKQLAQEIVMKASELPILANEIEVS
jgi:hypothetical protein